MKKIFGIILVLLIVLVVGRNFIIKAVVQAGVKTVTGLPLEIGSFKVGLTSTDIHIKDFKLKNPEGFEEEVMMEIPELFLDYRLGGFLTGKIHVEDFRFHLKEFNVVKKADGTSNLDSLTALQEAQDEGKKEDKPKKEAASKKKQELIIDNLSLRIDEASATTYSGSGKPSVKTFNIGINEVHKDIESLKSVVLIIIMKIALKAPAIAAAGNIDMGILGDVMSGTLGKATELLGVGTDAIGGATGAATDAIDGAKGALSETTGKLKGLLGK